jgi:hypothetical protein
MTIEALGWKVLLACNLLCLLPGDSPTATPSCRLPEARTLPRDAALMGTNSPRIRIAVKDAATNARMAEILRQVLDPSVRALARYNCLNLKPTGPRCEIQPVETDVRSPHRRSGMVTTSALSCIKICAERANNAEPPAWWIILPRTCVAPTSPRAGAGPTARVGIALCRSRTRARKAVHSRAARRIAQAKLMEQVADTSGAAVRQPHRTFHRLPVTTGRFANRNHSEDVRRESSRSFMRPGAFTDQSVWTFAY